MRASNFHLLDLGKSPNCSILRPRLGSLFSSWGSFEAFSPSTMRLTLDFVCESPTAHWQFAADFLDRLSSPFSVVFGHRHGQEDCRSWFLRLFWAPKQGWLKISFRYDWQCWKNSTGWTSALFLHLKNLNLHWFRIDFYMNLHRFSIDLRENIPIDPVGMKFSLVLSHLPALGRVSTPIC